MSGSGGWDHGGPSPGGGDFSGIDASTTVNPFPPPALLEDLPRALREARRYPDPDAGELRKSLARRFSQEARRLATGPGATALLYALIRDRSVRRVLLFSPIFSEFAQAAESAGKPVVRIPPDLLLSFYRMEAGSPVVEEAGERWGIDPVFPGSRGVGSGDLAVLENPVSPTGQEFSQEEVRALGHAMARAGGTLLVDESFQDFLGNRGSVLTWAGVPGAGLAVLRSATKITGLPGIRTGLLAGDPEILSRIRNAFGPWSTGALETAVLAWWGAQEGPGDFGWREEVRENLSRALLDRGMAVLPGSGPFLLVRPGWREEEGMRVRARLLSRGLRIRLATGFGPPAGGGLVRLGFAAFLDPERVADILEEGLRPDNT